MEAKLDQLRSLVEAADRDKVELLNQLEEEKRWVLRRLLLLLLLSESVSCEEKLHWWTHPFISHRVELLNALSFLFDRKVEDLQFRVEEACITKGDLEVTCCYISCFLIKHILSLSQDGNFWLTKLKIFYLFKKKKLNWILGPFLFFLLSNIYFLNLWLLGQLLSHWPNYWYVLVFVNITRAGLNL